METSTTPIQILAWAQLNVRPTVGTSGGRTFSTQSVTFAAFALPQPASALSACAWFRARVWEPMLDDLDLNDAINAEIWATSPQLQATLSRAYPRAAAGLLQAVLPGGPLPWVPDLVGRAWREAGSVFVVGSAYAPFIEPIAGRARVMTERDCRSAPTASAFLRAFVRDVVSGDPNYYGPLRKLLSGAGLSPREAVLLDLVRGSFVELASREGGDNAIKAAPDVFCSYMEAGWAWTWRRMRESRACDVIVLGQRAERGFLTMLAREGVSVRVAQTGERLNPDEDILSKASARGVSAWLRDGMWWEGIGRVDGHERRWRVLPVVHPARANQHDPGYHKSAALLREMMRQSVPKAAAVAPLKSPVQAPPMVSAPTTAPIAAPTRAPERRVVNTSPPPPTKPSRDAEPRKPTSTARLLTQRDVMRQVWARLGPNHERVIAAYAAEERAGRAPRDSNIHGESPEVYARKLLNNGVTLGWLKE